MSTKVVLVFSLILVIFCNTLSQSSAEIPDFFDGGYYPNIDQNQNGKISMGEAFDSIPSIIYARINHMEVTKSDVENIKRLSKSFWRSLDFNGDGYITKKELEKNQQQAEQFIVKFQKDLDHISDGFKPVWRGFLIHTKNIDREAAYESKPGSEYTVTQKASYPHIVSIDAPWVKEWNQKVKNFTDYHPSCEGNGAEYIGKYKILYSQRNFISLEKNVSTRCGEAPRWYSSTGYYNVQIIEGQITEPVLSDVFDQNTNWENTALKLANQNMESNNSSAEKWIATKPSMSWTLLHDGMLMNFGRVNGYAQGEYSALLPWEDIKGYISDGFKKFIPEKHK